MDVKFVAPEADSWRWSRQRWGLIPGPRSRSSSRRRGHLEGGDRRHELGARSLRRGPRRPKQLAPLRIPHATINLGYLLSAFPPNRVRVFVMRLITWTTDALLDSAPIQAARELARHIARNGVVAKDR